MTNAQDSTVNNPVQLIEIDKFIYDLQVKLSFGLTWLTHDYGRAYRHIKLKDGNRLYLPEIYRGIHKGQPQYETVSPDNDKKGSCFFVVGPEVQEKFESNSQNYLYHDVGIVFWANLKAINVDLLATELFTQQLISQVRSILTNQINGKGYRIEIDRVVREFNEIYKEFTLDETENYLMAPYQQFRFNCRIRYQEGCPVQTANVCDAIQQNLSPSEIQNCVIPGIDFSDPDNKDALTPTQIGFICTGDPAHITNSDGSFDLNVPPGSDYELPDITVSVGGGGTLTFPSAKDLNMQNYFLIAQPPTGNHVAGSFTLPWNSNSPSVIRSLGTIEKISDNAQWNGGADFIIEKTGNFTLHFRLVDVLNPTTTNLMAGIDFFKANSDFNYTGIDMCWYRTGLNVNIFENGEQVYQFPTAIDDNTQYIIQRQGNFIFYKINGTTVRTQSVINVGKMFFTNSIFNVGAKIENINIDY